MQRLTFTTMIRAPREKIWKIMLDDATYRQWTSAFTEGSYAVSDWQEGSRALFLSPNGSGMISRVAAHRPNEYISFEHLGTLREGVEDLSSDEVKAWAGAQENYTLTDSADGTPTLLIEMDTNEESREFFENTWPQALEKLKELCERDPA